MGSKGKGIGVRVFAPIVFRDPPETMAVLSRRFGGAQGTKGVGWEAYACTCTRLGHRRAGGGGPSLSLQQRSVTFILPRRRASAAGGHRAAHSHAVSTSVLVRTSLYCFREGADFKTRL